MKRQGKREMTPLRAMRTAKGLTLKELAWKAGLHYSTVQEIDADGARTGLKTKFMLSLALGDRSFKLWPKESRADLRRLASLR